MSNKKFGLDERASGKIVTITTGIYEFDQVSVVYNTIK